MPQQVYLYPEGFEGYRISDVDDASNPKYYGFLNKDGAWCITKEDTTNKTYRYIVGSSGYSASWTDRVNLSYTYFSDVF